MKKWLSTFSQGTALGLTLLFGMQQVEAAPPTVAVTGLTYQERVREYFRVVSAQRQSSYNASSNVNSSGHHAASGNHARAISGRGAASASNYGSSSGHHYSGSNNVNAQSSSSYYEAEGTYSYVESGELHKFTGDIKGALIKGGGLRVVQGKPYKGSDTDQIHDIIARIKKGLYPGADYVLFGTISDMQFNTAHHNFDGRYTNSLSLDLVAEFSLINTRTYEVKAAFSAHGTGQDTKIISSAGRASLNRAKVVRETAQTLADDVYSQLIDQFPQGGTDYQFNHSYQPRHTQQQEVPKGPVKVY